MEYSSSPFLIKSANGYTAIRCIGQVQDVMKFMREDLVFNFEVNWDRSISGTDRGTADPCDGCGFSIDKVDVDISVIGYVGCGAGVEVPEIFGFNDLPSCHIRGVV